MVSKRFYHQLLIRLALLLMTCLFLAFSIFFFPNYSLIILTIAALLAQTVFLVKYLNTVNRKLENFFLFYLSGEVVSGSVRRSKNDEFSSLYDYFDLINDKLEQARVKNELQNNYFKTIVDETSVGLISFKADGSVELFNEAAKKIFGINVLRNLKKLNNIKEGFSDQLINLDSNERILITFVLAGELIQLATKKVKFKTMNEELHLVSFQNIKPELEEKEIESWQRLIRILTHEIMNSMTPIMTITGTITKQFSLGEGEALKSPEEITEGMMAKTVKGLGLIQTRGKNLIRFVQSYQHITKLPKPDFRITPVRELLNRISALFEEEYRASGIRLDIQCNPSLFIQADGTLLEQVLINLVKNATEALENTQEPQIILKANSLEDQVIIQIADNGKGIPADLIDDIFVPFFTTKQKGSGIGLSLSRQIIRLHGGSLTVQSVPGDTVFTIRI